MRTQEFEQWLKKKHKKEGTWRTYLTDAKRIFKEKGDLDLIIKNGEHEVLIEKWRYSKKEGKKGEINIPHGHEKPEEAAGGFIQALKSYAEFYESSPISTEVEDFNTSIRQKLTEIEADLQDEGAFSPVSIEDAKDIAFRAIVQRRGQAEFRKKLLDAYDFKCAISETDCIETLEAAHIIPYKGEGTNHVQNGILLRSDLHTLFDLGLLTITEDLIVVISDKVESEHYRIYDGISIATPRDPSRSPSIEALRIRNEPNQSE